MKRRNFLKMAGVAGASSVLPLYPGADLFASHPGDYDGPLYLLVDASGGWDPTSLCDPKGFENSDSFARVNNYLRSEIPTIPGSPIRYAPVPPIYRPGGSNFVGNEDLQFIARDFFTKHFTRLLIVNGIDTRTTSHNSGRRHNWSGELGTRGYPSFGAVVAGLGGSGSRNRPLSFITNGGYDVAADLVVPVRMNSEGMRTLFEVAFPNRHVTDNPGRIYFPEGAGEALELIQNARLSREAEMLATGSSSPLEQRLPRIRTALNRWIGARQQTGHIVALANDLQQNPAPSQASLGIRSRAYSLYQQGRLALAGYEQGVTCSALLRASGGFDTHSDHDQRQYPRLMELIQGVDAIWEEARTRGLENRLVIIMASDFGRTNRYNSGNGKDHWPITSWMIMGNDSPGGAIAGTSGGIVCNRVIGQTTVQHNRIDTNPITLDGTPSINNVRMTPAHAHWNLRRLANISAATMTSLRLDLDSTGELDFFS